MTKLKTGLRVENGKQPKKQTSRDPMLSQKQLRFTFLSQKFILQAKSYNPL